MAQGCDVVEKTVAERVMQTAENMANMSSETASLARNRLAKFSDDRPTTEEAKVGCADNEYFPPYYSELRNLLERIEQNLKNINVSLNEAEL